MTLGACERTGLSATAWATVFWGFRVAVTVSMIVYSSACSMLAEYVRFVVKSPY